MLKISEIMQKQSFPKSIRTLSSLPYPVAVVGFDYCQSDRDIVVLHSHPELEIGYCHRGDGIFVINSDVIQYSSGDVVVIPARMPHFAQSIKGTTSDWTFIYLDPQKALEELGFYQKSIRLASYGCAHFSRQVCPVICDTARLLSLAVVGQAKQKQKKGVVQGFVLSLFSLIASKTEADNQNFPPVFDMGRVSPAITYLTANFDRPLLISDLAKQCCLSVPHFRRLFNQIVGMSPRGYLFKLRIAMAKGMLECGQKTILDIALAVGFPTLSSFNRQFKALTGMNPRQWRRNFRSNTKRLARNSR